MDASHILVGGLLAISISLLVGIEIRSRRNTSAQREQSLPVAPAEPQLPPRKRRRGRR
jgi:hypothetical protein